MDKINLVFSERPLYGDGVKIYLASKQHSTGKIFAITNLEFQEWETTVPETPIQLEYNVAQMLMDSLWDCGLRPSEGSGSAGAFKAVQQHKDDLKELSDRLLTLVEKHEKN